MTMDNHENQPMDREPANEADTRGAVDASRRRFTRLGLGASGVVMTLASRSVLAQNTCKSPSGFLSNNASAHGDPAICTGTDPNGWAQTQSWPIDETAPFTSYFGQTAAAWTKKTKFSFFDAPLASSTPWNPSKSGSTGNNGQAAKADAIGSETSATMRDVLKNDTTPSVVKYLIAAYLNAASGRNAFPTMDQVRTIYTEWASKRTYEVSAGIFWDELDIEKYLKATMTPIVA